MRRWPAMRRKMSSWADGTITPYTALSGTCADRQSLSVFAGRGSEPLRETFSVCVDLRGRATGRTCAGDRSLQAPTGLLAASPQSLKSFSLFNHHGESEITWNARMNVEGWPGLPIGAPHFPRLESPPPAP
jgi:hypothetical protein